MADLESKLRGFLVGEAKRRKNTWMRAGRPNGLAISRDLKIGQATVYRILHGRPGASDSSNPRSGKISHEVVEALMAYFRFSTMSELIEVIENTQPIPPIPKVSKKRARKT